ncbi:putative T-complex protein [Chloropicon primus]|uniref:Putative T-complex protein n=2 Tax=Chloropicon primus TaxID=1764295 RepID=A0A5B8MZJ1_9CHLO|nr:putative T-complex protein [Chloropicon primus]|eukprot:QDZ25909.1 putative T-complex protein [Chloropicon primus]
MVEEEAAAVLTPEAERVLGTSSKDADFDDTPVKTRGHELTFEELIEQQLKLEEERRGEASSTTVATGRPKFKFLRKGEREGRRGGSAQGEGGAKRKTLGPRKQRGSGSRKAVGAARVPEEKPAAAVEVDEAGRHDDGYGQPSSKKSPSPVKIEAHALSPSQTKYVEQFYEDYLDDDEEEEEEVGFEEVSSGRAQSPDGSETEFREAHTFKEVFGQQLERLDRELAEGSVSYESEEEYDSLDDEEGQSPVEVGMRGHLSAERRANWEKKTVQEELELREFEQLERQIQEELEGAASGATADEGGVQEDDHLYQDMSRHLDLSVGGGSGLHAGDSGMPTMLQQASFSGKSFSETMKGISLETQFDDTTKWEEEEDDEAVDVEVVPQMRDEDGAAGVGSYAEQHARALHGRGADNGANGAKDRKAKARKVGAGKGGRSSAPRKAEPSSSNGDGHGDQDRPMSAREEKHIKLLDEEIKKVVEERKKFKRMQTDYKKRVSSLEQAEQEFDRRREAEIENIQVMKEKAEKKIKRDKRVLDQQSRTLLSKLPSKKDREEIQQLEEQLEKEKAAHKRKERTHKMNEDRLRRQVAELTKRNEELKDEIRRLEKRQLEAFEKRLERDHAKAERGVTHNRHQSAAAAVQPLSEKENREQRQPRKKPAQQSGGANSNSSKKGPSKVTYPNGTQKHVYLNGDTVIHFNNGDVKKSTKGTTEYYYAEVDTWHSTHDNGIEVFHFPSGQIEAHFPNGAKEVLFPDGIAHRLTDPDGEEHQLIDPKDLCEVFSKPKPQLTVVS